MKKFLFIAVAATGCSARYTPTEQSLTVKNETKQMLQSKVDKVAGAETEGLTYYFILHENKTFAAIIDIHGTKKYDFSAGTFQSKGDTLQLNYYKNLQSGYLTDKAVVDNVNNEIYFLDKDLTKIKKLKFLNQL
jgi:hypothetical protein